MPAEVFEEEKFLKLSEQAFECRVRRGGDKVKLKLRTARKLYTIKLETEKAEQLLKQIRCQIVEA